MVMPSSAKMDEVAGVHAAVVRIAEALEVAQEARKKEDVQTTAARNLKMAEKQFRIQLKKKSPRSRKVQNASIAVAEVTLQLNAQLRSTNGAEALAIPRTSAHRRESSRSRY